MNLNYNELNKNSYNDYIEKILNIYRLSNKDSSILFDLKIEDYKCYCKMCIISQSGDKQEFCDVILDCDEEFYKNFLDVLVTKFNNDVRVKIKDIVNLDKDSLVTYRMITENNDLFSIDGLSMEHAKHLKQLCSDDFQSESKGINQLTNIAGFGSLKMFVLMIMTLVVSFVGIVIILG